MNKFLLAVVALSLALLASVSAQTLAPAALVPVADGHFGAAEYSFTGSYNGMKLGTSLSADGKTLFVALEAPTTGWVAVGLGSLKMNGAFMVLAYDKNGTPSISEQTGSGHGHKPNAVNILTAGAVKEAGGVTVLEFALPAAGFTGTASLKMLVAYGNNDNFTSIHSKFASTEISIVKK